MKILKKLNLVLCLGLCACILNAEEGLTEKSIQKWIKAYPVVNAWMEEHEEVVDEAMDQSSIKADTIDEMMQAGFETLQTLPIYGELDKMVKKLGYSGADEMMNDTIRIVKAASSIIMKEEMAEHGGGIDMEEIQAQIAQIEQMEGLSDEQKAMMKGQIEAAMGQLSGLMEMFNSVSEEDIEAITPYFDQISEIMDAGDDEEDEWGY